MAFLNTLRSCLPWSQRRYPPGRAHLPAETGCSSSATSSASSSYLNTLRSCLPRSQVMAYLNTLRSCLPRSQVMSYLNTLFTLFDELIDQYEVGQGLRRGGEAKVEDCCSDCSHIASYL